MQYKYLYVHAWCAFIGDGATAVAMKDFPAYVKKKCSSAENIYGEFMVCI